MQKIDQNQSVESNPGPFQDLPAGKLGKPDYEFWKRAVVTDVARLPTGKFCVATVVIALVLIAYLFGEKFGPWFVVSLVILLKLFGFSVFVYGGSDNDAEISQIEPENQSKRV